MIPYKESREDRFWVWLHRFAARRAQRVYARRPSYRSNFEAGVAASRSKWTNAVHTHEDEFPASGMGA